MPRENIRRHAADNIYLHKDFHGALSSGIQYLDERYGAEAVRLFLRNFAHAFYAPLREAIRQRGLAALKEHLESVYRTEGGGVAFESSADELFVRVAACPAVTHMRQHGYPVARLFCETLRTVDAAICEDTPFTAELLEYDPATGRSVQHFFRSTP